MTAAAGCVVRHACLATACNLLAIAAAGLLGGWVGFADTGWPPRLADLGWLGDRDMLAGSEDPTAPPARHLSAVRLAASAQAGWAAELAAHNARSTPPPPPPPCVEVDWWTGGVQCGHPLPTDPRWRLELLVRGDLDLLTDAPLLQRLQALVNLAVGETVILLHPLLPSVGVSIWMERGCQQNDSLADG